MPSMFDELPFAAPPLDFNLTLEPGAGVALPASGDIFAPAPVETVVSGDWDSLFSSGKVAADAALNSMRSIFNIFPDTQSPAATPAGPDTMERAGAGGGFIEHWSGVLTQDIQEALAAAGGFVSSTVNATEQRVGAGVQSAGSVVKDIFNWTGSLIGSTVGSIFSGAGLSPTVLIIIGAVVLVLVLPKVVKA